MSPANPQASPGNPVQITFNAAVAVATTTANLSVTGTSGALSHSQVLSLAVNAGKGSGGLSRTHYVRTDLVTEYGYTLNSNWMVFDPGTKRFFVSDPNGNQIQVIDAASQKQIASILVPGALGIAATPDHSLIYAGTEVGDVYTIDPVAMQVTHRYVAAQIGPYGYESYSALPLADGKVALLGGQGGIPSVDGYTSFAIWNPADNSIVIYGGPNIDPFPSQQSNCVGNIGVFTLTGDRSLIVEASIDSDGTVCTVNPDTGQMKQITLGGFTLHMVATPDGNSLLVPQYGSSGGESVAVYNVHTLTQTGTITVAGDTGSDASMIVSPDSSTLYITSPGFIYAYNISSDAQLGWTPNLVVEPTAGGLAVGAFDGPNLQAWDTTGLIAGPMEEGVGFVDTTALQVGPVGTNFANAYVNPPTGPATGGTSVQWDGSPSGQLAAVYFGANQAADAAFSGGKFSAITPAGTPGPVDLYTLMQDGGEQFVPEGFSYGPTILEAAPDSSTSEGGGLGILYGYGLGSTAYAAPIPSDLSITIGGQPAAIIGYSGNAYGTSSPPFPLEAVAYTIPSASAGTSQDITVTTAAGSTTVHGGMTYLPATQSFPLLGAELAQGVYDAKRNLYYFTDASEIRVFSRAEGQWLTPIPVPAAPSGLAHRLWGIALSPDDSQLAVSDTSAAMIYLIDPDTPASVKSFAVTGPWASGSLTTLPGVDTYPAGLAVSNQGVVYYTAYILGGDGFDGFFSLDTNSGAVTDYKIVSFGNNQLRDAISSDNARVFFNHDGEVFSIDTATGAVFYAPISPGCCYGDYELSLSNNQTQLEATSYLYDADLSAESYLTMNDREAMNIAYVYGAKMSPDGTLLFQPSVDGIDVFDGHLGTLRTRIALPFALSQNYDALVSDGTDNVLVTITGATGNGIAIVDLSGLSEPNPLPYVKRITNVPLVWQQRGSKPPVSASSSVTGPSIHPRAPLSQIPHSVNPRFP